MKNIILIITLALVFAFSNMAMAEGPQVTVGLKTWTANWQQKIEFPNELTGETETSSDTSEYGLMYGPVVNVRYEKFYAAMSYLLGGSFSFEWDELDYDSPTSSYGWDYDEKYDRTDLDISIGYYVHPNVSVFLGYKNVDFDRTITIQENETLSLDLWEDGSEKSSATLKGPAFGVSGYYPIGQTRFILLGSLSYLSLNGESEGESLGDYTGPSMDFGGAYAFETIPVSITAGYKYQSVKSDDSEDTFSGITFGVNYTIN